MFQKIKKISLAAIAIAALSLYSCNKGEEVVPDDNNNNTEVNEERAAALKLYQDEYLASATPDIGWTGNADNCDAGDTPQATKDKILQRTNYFRTIVGLPAVSLNMETSAKAQEAALVFKAAGSISHDLDASWPCYTENAAEAAGKSNIFGGVSGANAISGYIKDPGAYNYFVGHRRWILFPRLQEIGTGDTDASNSLWVLSNFLDTSPSGTPEFIAYPPKGYVPQNLVYDRWSFSLSQNDYFDQHDFSSASVSMKDESGNNVNLNLLELNTGGYGDMTIVWEPTGIDNTNTEDVTYTVEVNNVVLKSGETKNYSYEVTLFKAE